MQQHRTQSAGPWTNAVCGSTPVDPHAGFQIDIGANYSATVPRSADSSGACATSHADLQCDT